MIDRILILDFGSQVTQLIARRVREAGVYSAILPFNADPQKIADFGAKGIILSGGPASVTATDTPRISEVVFDLGLPILAICYGQQALCAQLGGETVTAEHHEFGRAFLSISAPCALFDGVWGAGDHPQVWMSHGDRVVRLPDGFRVVATSDGAPFAACADDHRRYYGVQFHPEVVHTPDGAKLITNFVTKIAGCTANWTMGTFRDHAMAAIRHQVGDGKVVCGLSGGVDSSVAAKLIHEAIGDQLTCIFVDHGLLRDGEAQQVVDLYRGHYNIPLIAVDASERFLTALQGVEDPEQKRKTIGKLFIDVFEDEAKKIGNVQFLAQGTLYPDVVESIAPHGGPGVTIKSHHNVGGLPDRMKLKLVEPLRELFKDEVRALGRELGLPDAMIQRHPFPGPGLAIRVLGAITPEKLDILRKVDDIFLNEIRAAGLYDAIWQAFAVLLPVRSVGVMGDARSYDHVCALRAVSASDGMTAEAFHFDPVFLNRVATRIVNEVRGVNRVTYDITSKPPGTIEWE